MHQLNTSTVAAETDIQPSATPVGSPFLQRVVADLSLKFAFLVSAMPRGVMAIVMASLPANAMARDYVRQNHHRHDRASWLAITSRRAVRTNSADVLGTFREKNRKFDEPVTGKMAAVAVQSPLFAGYPAALIAARNDSDSAFSDADLVALDRLAQQLSGDPRYAGADASPDVSSRASAFIALDDQGEVRYSSEGSAIPAGQHAQFVSAVNTLRNSNQDTATLERWMLTLPSGVRVPYRAVRYHDYPALGGGAVTLFAGAPSPAQWGALRTDQVSADAELPRLLPAAHSIVRDFATQPSLNELASMVRLSPFHFHRRFTDLLGTTPKHLLLDCQIELARTELRTGHRSLTEIAAACGFAHQSHFTSRFKQATGLTPTQYRRLAGGGSSV